MNNPSALQSRKLGAVMFTDIVGYTSLMNDDEQYALEVLKQNRALQKPVIEEFNGKWIKEIGDGVLSSLTTGSDAVYAAIKIQKDCNTSKDFKLRIGIHLGEVFVENDDIFGDTVNIASRIQAIAEPGCIYISETVHQSISNKKDITTRFIEEAYLKHVQQPIKIYEVMTYPFVKKQKEDLKNFLNVLLTFLVLLAFGFTVFYGQNDDWRYSVLIPITLLCQGFWVTLSAVQGNRLIIIAAYTMIIIGTSIISGKLVNKKQLDDSLSIFSYGLISMGLGMGAVLAIKSTK